MAGNGKSIADAIAALVAGHFAEQGASHLAWVSAAGSEAGEKRAAPIWLDACADAASAKGTANAAAVAAAAQDIAMLAKLQASETPRSASWA